jgi:hypothetical protein
LGRMKILVKNNSSEDTDRSAWFIIIECV